MNRKQLLLLLVIVLIVGGAGLAVYQRASSMWEEKAAPTGRILGDFALNDVTRVTIEKGNASVTLVNNNGVWTVGERENYPAHFERVRSLIQTLWQLKAVQEINVGPSQLDRLDLAAPEKGGVNAAMRVELQNKDSKPVASLLIGKPYFQQSQNPNDAGSPGSPTGRYVMPAGATSPKAFLVSAPLTEVSLTPSVWLDHTFLRIARIQSVAILSGSAQWKLSRDTDSATEWKLADGKPGESVESAKVPPFAELFGAPGFLDVLPVSVKSDHFDTTATVQTFDGFTYTLKFGPADKGGNVPLAIAVTAQRPDETLARAKALEGRVYLVSKAAFEALWKPRAELLAEKRDTELPPVPAALQTKPEPSPAATQPTGNPDSTPSAAKP